MNGNGVSSPAHISSRATKRLSREQSRPVAGSMPLSHHAIDRRGREDVGQDGRCGRHLLPDGGRNGLHGALMGASWGGAKAMTATSGLVFAHAGAHRVCRHGRDPPGHRRRHAVRVRPAGWSPSPMAGDVMQANWAITGSARRDRARAFQRAGALSMTIESFIWRKNTAPRSSYCPDASPNSARR